MPIRRYRRIRDLKRALKFLRRMAPPRSSRARRGLRHAAEGYAEELKEKLAEEKTKK